MAEKGALQSAREWVVDHKLRAVGTLWLSGIVGSIAYNWVRAGGVLRPPARVRIESSPICKAVPFI
ncbi:Hypoxia-responsive family protein [Zea mays]|uniref:Hypoxia-responsive family protein n=1 Tax=Zea mays TaxID=4577 RepID=A0A1D6F4A3_MAIZE|nr:Hypoxia-responsive family protein [Zea mays]